ncbi:transporter substrate-binding domain-containing protein [Brevibacterium sp.]|uniref:transporter substrate-binding domain-containing protein n=1 Tax=Brevibacterium sp. TaxID=1701 RepID=UPI0025BEBD5D|nr:transporter substrate-binding domain-containing protein [Brevibacterium sp.]
MIGQRTLAVVLAALSALGTAGCSVPADPEGTLDRARHGELVVGVSHSPPWTDARGSAPTGTEPELVRSFADSLDAEVDWEVAGEERLMTLLEEGDLDLVVGGLTTDSPWTSEAALTTDYTTTPGSDGGKDRHVMAVRMGENALQTELERHLLSPEVQERLRETAP